MECGLKLSLNDIINACVRYYGTMETTKKDAKIKPNSAMETTAYECTSLLCTYYDPVYPLPFKSVLLPLALTCSRSALSFSSSSSLMTNKFS